MLIYSLKRLGIAFLVAIAVSLITFTLLRLSGDPAAALSALLEARRACNKFRDGAPPVPEGVLEAIVRDASLAPSSFNLQVRSRALAGWRCRPVPS